MMRVKSVKTYLNYNFYKECYLYNTELLNLVMTISHDYECRICTIILRKMCMKNSIHTKNCVSYEKILKVLLIFQYFMMHWNVNC